jgi:hypothetical protein
MNILQDKSFFKNILLVDGRIQIRIIITAPDPGGAKGNGSGSRTLVLTKHVVFHRPV